MGITRGVEKDVLFQLLDGWDLTICMSHDGKCPL